MFMERIEVKIGKLKLELCQEEGRKLQRISTRPYLSFLKDYRMLPNKQKQDIDVEVVEVEVVVSCSRLGLFSAHIEPD